MVCVHLFFVISGFSITLKPLKLARRGQYDALLESLVSATFRRAARLYLPCLALLLGIVGLVCLGSFHYVTELGKRANWPFVNRGLPDPPVFDTYGEQFRHFWTCFWEWSDPVSHNHFPTRERRRQIWIDER
jgi:peptidoglycan/LPS O-acetylase OafA/YrhL